MRKRGLLLWGIGILWWLSSGSGGYAQECSLAMANAYAGRQFRIVLPPPNDEGTPDLLVTIVGIDSGIVWVDVPALGWQLPPFVLRRGEVRVLTTQKELPLLEDQVGKIEYTAIRIRSSGKIVVIATSQQEEQSMASYVAYPTSVWGTHYVFAGYYDNKGEVYAGHRTLFLNGFYVIARENGTNVQIRLRGHGRGWMRINGQDQQVAFPRDWGKSFQFTLNAGEVLDFCSLGLSLDENGNEGELDITGTEITASQPVGIVSVNGAAHMPYQHVTEFNGEPIAEMLPPKGVWGKRYITRALRSRGPLENHPGGPIYSGDNYRVVALEANTVFTVRWYDPQSGQLKGQWSGLLRRAGEFMEYVKGGNLQEFIEGYAVWEADRPFMLVQYGGVGDAAVFLWAIPVEQYLCEQVGYQWEDVTTRLVANLLIAAGGDMEVAGKVRYNG